MEPNAQPRHQWPAIITALTALSILIFLVSTAPGWTEKESVGEPHSKASIQLPQADWKKPKNFRIRLVASSCMYQGKLWQPMYNIMLDGKPDHILLMGDNIYLDMKPTRGCKRKEKRRGRKANALNCYPTPSKKVKWYKRWHDIQREYNRVLNRQDFLIHLNKRKKSKAGVWVMWDDHDYGDNNSGANNPHKHKTRAGLVYYWDRINKAFGNRQVQSVIDMLKRTRNKNRGIYWTTVVEKKFCQGRPMKIRLYGIDVRWYRNGRTTLGSQQKQWLKSLIETQSDGIDFHVFISGLTMFYKLRIKSKHKEGWYGSDINFLTNLLKKKNLIEKSVVLDGDIHWSTVNERNGLYEIVSSSLTHSLARTAWLIWPFWNRRKYAKARFMVKSNNFAVIDIGMEGWELTWVDEFGKPIASASYSFRGRHQKFWKKIWNRKGVLGK